jgi:hypothetical protein
VNVPGVGDLIDRGIKAYLQGRVPDALQAFEEVLSQDPGNSRAKSYLLLIRGGMPGGAAASEAVRAAAEPSRPPPPAPSPATAAADHADPPSRPTPAPARAAASAAPSRPPRAREEYVPSPWDDGPAPAASFVLDPSGGLDLDAVAEKSDLHPLVPQAAQPASAGTVKSDVAVWMQAARELHALGDFTGSIDLIEKILQIDAEHREAREYLRQNEATLTAMYESKLGPLHGVPRLAIKPEEIMWLNLDHRAGFLLAQIDGAVDFEAIFALSGLPRLDTARILATLIQDGVIRA